MIYARELTLAEALTHPWWGVACPSCKAEPGEPCRGCDGYRLIHGQRTAARALDWVDPRPLAEPRREPEQLDMLDTDPHPVIA